MFITYMLYNVVLLQSVQGGNLKLVRILNPSEFHSIIHFIQAYAVLMNAY